MAVDLIVNFFDIFEDAVTFGYRRPLAAMGRTAAFAACCLAVYFLFDSEVDLPGPLVFLLWLALLLAGSAALSLLIGVALRGLAAVVGRMRGSG